MQQERSGRGTGWHIALTGGLVLSMVLGGPWVVDGVASGVQSRAQAADDRSIDVRVARPSRGSRVGISVTDVEPGRGDETPREGAHVTQIDPDGPASDAGFEVGDVIVEFDGERVRSARQLSRLVEETPAGRAVPTRVVRDGSSVELEVTPESGPDRIVSLVERFDEAAGPEGGRVRRFRRVWPEGFDLDGNLENPDRESFEVRVMRRGGRRLGIRGFDLGPQLASYFAVEDGVLVASVDEGSVGASAGLRAGDVITALADQPVDSVETLRRGVGRLDGDQTFTIEITRDGSPLELEGRFPRSRRSPGVGLGV